MKKNVAHQVQVVYIVKKIVMCCKVLCCAVRCWTDRGEVLQHLPVLLSALAEAPLGLIEEHVEVLQQRDLLLQRDAHVVLHCVQSSQNQVENTHSMPEWETTMIKHPWRSTRHRTNKHALFWADEHNTTETYYSNMKKIMLKTESLIFRCMQNNRFK